MDQKLLVVEVLAVVLVLDVIVVVITLEMTTRKQGNLNDDYIVFRRGDYIRVVVVFVLVALDRRHSVMTTARLMPQSNDPTKIPAIIGEPNEPILLLVLYII